ncbi:MAG: AraC family transcriptional regulator ligand-binding domain-containing protein [Rhodospirillaceae bacterium]
MGLISSLFAHKVVTVAAGGDPALRHSLLRSIGLEPDAPIDPKRMVPAADYYDFCERAARACGDGIGMVLRVGASMRCDDYGAFGLAWKSATTLRGSYQRSERYWRVLTSVAAYTLTEEEGRAYMTLHREGPRRLGMRLSNEQTLIAIHAISQEVSQAPFVPLAVYFKHPAPGDIAAHEAHFGCPVHFGADRDAIAVSLEILNAPNRLGDASISAFFQSHLDREVAELPEDQALDHQVRSEISQLLSDGVPSVDAVAERLAMSRRTLQRRLSAKGVAFQDLVEEARKDLAKRLLRRTDYALAEIAFLTGFAEQSTFSRAFKRWSGQTPATYRREASAA